MDVQTGVRQSITVTASSGLTEEEISKATSANEDWMLGQKEDPDFQDRKAKAEELFKEFESLWPGRLMAELTLDVSGPRTAVPEWL